MCLLTDAFVGICEGDYSFDSVSEDNIQAGQVLLIPGILGGYGCA
jgi:hypothetical protein